MDTEKVNRISKAIESAYINVDEPSWTFAVQGYEQWLPMPLLRDLLWLFPIKNATDLNDHVSLNLEIFCPGDSDIILMLSFVGPYAMVIRRTPSKRSWKLLENANSLELTYEEQLLFDRLERYKFEVITKEEALIPVRLKLFNTDPEDVVLFNALFDDAPVPFNE